MSHKKLTYNSTRYHTLCYAKMVRRPFALSDVKGCLAGTWHRGGVADLKRGLEFLVQAGFLAKHRIGTGKNVADMWQITEAGETAIYDTARRSTHKRVHMDDSFEELSALFVGD